MEIYLVIKFWYETPKQFEILQACSEKEYAEFYKIQSIHRIENGYVCEVRTLEVSTQR